MVRQGLSPRTEGGAFHIDIGATVMHSRSGSTGALEQQFPQFLANRLGKGNVGDDSAPKEGMSEGLFGSIQELIRQDNVARPVLRLQRSNGADTDDPGHIKLL